MLFEPVVGVLLAALLLDEDLQPIQLVGGVGILAAAVILQRSARHEQELEPMATPAMRDPTHVHLSKAS
jgi:hypothetical protein